MLDSATAYEPRRGTCAKRESNASPPRNIQLIVEGRHHTAVFAVACGDLWRHVEKTYCRVSKGCQLRVSIGDQEIRRAFFAVTTHTPLRRWRGFAHASATAARANGM